MNLLESKPSSHAGIQMSDQISRCVGLFAAKIIVLLDKDLHTITGKSGLAVIHEIALHGSARLGGINNHPTQRKHNPDRPILVFPPPCTTTYQDQDWHADWNLRQGFGCIIKRPWLGTVVDQYDSICVTIHVDCRGIERESSMRNWFHG